MRERLQPPNTLNTQKGCQKGGQDPTFKEDKDRQLAQFKNLRGCFRVFRVFRGTSTGAGQFGFADSGGAEEYEGADGARRGKAEGRRLKRAGADDGASDGLHGFVLADDALVENLVEAQEFFLLAFEQARLRKSA